MKTKLIIASLFINLLAFAQFGPSTNTHFPLATSTAASGFFVFNIPGVTNYNVPASNMLAFLNAAAEVPLPTKQDVTNTVNAISRGLVVSNAVVNFPTPGTRYTNETSFYALMFLNSHPSGANTRKLEIDNNLDGVYEAFTFARSDSPSSSHDALIGFVNPGGAFMITFTGGAYGESAGSADYIVYLK